MISFIIIIAVLFVIINAVKQNRNRDNNYLSNYHHDSETYFENKDEDNGISEIQTDLVIDTGKEIKSEECTNINQKGFVIEYNKYIRIKDESKVYGIGKYTVGTDIASGEYYFWGSNVLACDEEGQLHFDWEKDFYSFIAPNSHVEIKGGMCTSIDNIEYTFDDLTELDNNHMYRVGEEIPYGKYYFKYDASLHDKYEAFMTRQSCNIKMFKTYPYSNHLIDHGKKGEIDFDASVKFVQLINGKARLIKKGNYVSSITVRDNELAQERFVIKLLGLKNSVLIRDEGKVYFYCSIINKHMIEFINEFYSDITPIEKIFEEENDNNYRIVLQEDDLDGLCLLWSWYDNNVIGAPRIFNINITDLWVYCYSGYVNKYVTEEDLWYVLKKFGVEKEEDYKLKYEMFVTISEHFPVVASMLEVFKSLNTELEHYYLNRIYKNAWIDLVEYSDNTAIKLVNEPDLYGITRMFFKDAIYQYRAEWLGQQSLDIYIPSVSVAIEYQGEQHYVASTFFGGEEGLQQYQERDALKREKCEKEDVKLIEWMYVIPVYIDTFKYVMKINGVEL